MPRIRQEGVPQPSANREHIRRAERIAVDVKPILETPNAPPERQVIERSTLNRQKLDTVLKSDFVIAVPDDLRPAEQLTEESPVESQVDSLDDDLDYQPSFFNRLAKKPWARRFMSLLGLAGATKGMASGVESFREFDRQAELQQELISVAYDSSLDLSEQPDFNFAHQLDLSETISFDDDTQMSRGELLDTLSQQFTEQTKGLNGLARNIADTKLSDGRKGIDIFRFNLAYGNQVPLAPEALEVLGQVTDLSQAELDVYSKIVRSSVLERADMGNGMFYHDMDQFNVNQSPDKPDVAHRERLDASLKIIREAVKGLQIDQQSPEERKQTVEVVAEAIRETVEADNAWTQAAGYTEDWALEAMHSAFAEKFAPTLLANADEANLAWKKVAALDKEPAGQVKAMAEAINEQLEDKAKAFFTKAMELDSTEPSFAAGLEHFSR